MLKPYVAPCSSSFPTQLVEISIKQSPSAFQCASEKLRDDAVRKALGSLSAALRVGDRDERSCYSLVNRLTSPLYLRLRAAHPVIPQELAALAIITGGWADGLSYCSPRLKGDLDFVLKVVGKFGDALKYASPEMQASPLVVATALKHPQRSYCKWTCVEWWWDVSK